MGVLHEKPYAIMPPDSLSHHGRRRRNFLARAAGAALVAAMTDLHDASPALAGAEPLTRFDYAIDNTTALLFCAEAPLTPAPGEHDAKAVWARVLPSPEGTAFIYMHGHDNYVTVDRTGISRVPDWAQADPAARTGAASKKAAGLVYGLDRLETATERRPVVLVPEDSVLNQGSFWAIEPGAQYADPRRLGLLAGDCLRHLRALRNPSGERYWTRSTDPNRLARIYLAGHSGAGLPLAGAAVSDILLPATGIPADLWLFDCTYWSDTQGFVDFCTRWHSAGRLSAGDSRSARFVCIYRPGTDTEGVADSLRGEIAGLLGVEPATLVVDHTEENTQAQIAPALSTHGALFIRTQLPHDEIPTFFIPLLLTTSAG